ncbi:hypothetical protein [Swingsia samuiensis]|uniref:SLATT domain-containing protein n=1 Tax=Swingsia samuiensis TaxID=1293412 RepID=A0A4Y6UIH9_9PROT|nr:hypothetical protein [Swingsia samuiensis]QDH17403.1 hypothetical protein E3D00_07370 [Swingsia samuiensis]
MTRENNDFELWLARERVRQAEKAHENFKASLDRTKSRATSLLGWSITLATASVAVIVTQSTDKNVEAWCAAIGFTAASLLCAKVLYSTKIYNLSLAPGGLKGITDSMENKTELEFLNLYSEYADEIDTINNAAGIKDQRTMRVAWVIWCITPLLTLIVAILFLVLGGR